MPFLTRMAAGVVRALNAVAIPLCAVLALGADLAGAQAQDRQGRRPAFAQRIAHTFDFEEIETSPAPVPMYWVRAQDSKDAGRERPGFPIWNAAELDGQFTHGGVGAVKLPTRGGSTSLLLERGVLPVFNRADYALTAYVLTDQIRHARARMVARMLDSDGKVIPGSERASDLVLSQGTWTPLRMELSGEHATAAYMQLELQLLQPDQYQPRTLGSRQVYNEDFDGAAWFDDIIISQVPRIDISTAVESNIFLRPARPDINFLVRDLTGEKLSVRLTIHDAAGNIADQQDRNLSTGRSQAAWQPKLEKLGWYRASLEVLGAGTPLAATSVDFLWLDPRAASAGGSGIRSELDGSISDWRRFEVIAVQPEPALGTLLPDLLMRTGVGAVTVPLWEGLFDEAPTGKQGSGSLVAKLLERGKQVTLSMPRLPKDLADSARVDPGDPWELARRGPELWGPFVDRYLDRFGQSIRRWEVGPAWDDRIFWDTNRAATLNNVVKVFERLVPGPILCVPWRADLAITDEILAQLPQEAALRVFVPENMPSSSIASLRPREPGAPAARGPRKGPEISLVLGTDFDDRYEQRDGAAEVARRLAEFWRAMGDDPRASVALHEPWTWSEFGKPRMNPKPELATFSAMLPKLAGRRFVGELPSGPGMRALVFSPEGSLDATDQGLLIAWNESGMPRQTLRAFLGAATPRAYDIFGNEIPVADESDEEADFRITRLANGRTPEVLLSLTDEPVIVEGVDPRLALFQAGVRVDPSFIEVNGSGTEHAIVVSNPWPVPIDVNVRVVKPGGVQGEESRRDRSWRISPRQARVVVDPGQEMRIPIEMTFSPGEESGKKEFVLDVEAAADQTLGAMRIHREAELGSSQLDMQLAARLDEHQNVIVETYVSNRSKGPLDLQLTAFAPGLARSKAVVTNLMPGSVGVRAFRYERAANLRGQRVYVTLEDVAGSIRLNKAIEIQ
jgi:hypothetical protein